MNDASERLSEQLLVLRCQAGDENAFEELVASYHRRLRYYLRRILPRADRADDVLQEVWMAVFRGLPRLADPASFPAWLYRIARDKASVQWRGRPPERSMDLSESAAEPESNGEFRPEDAQEIHASLDRLAPEQREILVLRFLNDLTYEQIAEVLGCPIGTVRSRLHYAKSALREAIEQRKLR
jgi:RNA polymerase sigma-70 factor (ECF subfamily)